MGYIRHDAIVVTGYRDEHLKKARAKAEELGLIVTSIQEQPGTNGYASFLICADGSKEGWDTSDEHDIARDAWKNWVAENSWRNELPIEEWDNCLALDWVHVSYGGDEPEMAHILGHNSMEEGEEE